MAKSSTTKSAKKRVKVQELPTDEKKLTSKEMKTVKGGVSKNPTVKEMSFPPMDALTIIVKWDGPEHDAFKK